jgi:hypothetical protein
MIKMLAEPGYNILLQYICEPQKKIYSIKINDHDPAPFGMRNIYCFVNHLQKPYTEGRK